MKQVTKKDVSNLIKALKNNYEGCTHDFMIIILSLLLEIRDKLGNTGCKCNLQTDPKKLKKNDILIGEEE